jgi:uncharacterized protein involved in type VI secretion and phage assembly
MVVADRPPSNQAEADARARSMASHLSNAFIEAEGSSHGDPRLKAGCKVKIEDVGERFSGTYALSAATHIFRGTSGYETHFTVSGRTPRSLVDLMTPAAKRPWGHTVVVGVVTQNEDPEGMGRVRVRYPDLGDATEGWWARIACPSAGDGRGLMMTPVVGEEVLIAFEHGDVRRPYVLGSLFNGQDKPQALSKPDGSFALASDQSVSVTAAEGLKIKSGGGLQLASNGEMKVSSEQAISEQAQGNHSIQADGSVTIAAGASLTIEANADVTLSAPSITLQASGVVQISGSQVMLG